MNIDKALAFRANRKTRAARPFDNFFKTYESSLNAASALVDGEIDQKIEVLLGRSIIISLVSAIEVYCRDILEFSCRYCSNDFLQKILKAVAPGKVDLIDVIALWERGVNPYEVICAEQSFQGIERIEKIFSKFLPSGGLWATIMEMKVRLAAQPDNVVTWASADLEGLNRIFQLRHELVHNASEAWRLSEKDVGDIVSAAHMVFGMDVVLGSEIEKNKAKNWRLKLSRLNFY